MNHRRFDVFFYGLFMDRHILEGKGIMPVDIRLAVVSGLNLRIGARRPSCALPRRKCTACS